MGVNGGFRTLDSDGALTPPSTAVLLCSLSSLPHVTFQFKHEMQGGRRKKKRQLFWNETFLRVKHHLRRRQLPTAAAQLDHVSASLLLLCSFVSPNVWAVSAIAFLSGVSRRWQDLNYYLVRVNEKKNKLTGVCSPTASATMFHTRRQLGVASDL